MAIEAEMAREALANKILHGVSLDEFVAPVLKKQPRGRRRAYARALSLSSEVGQRQGDVKAKEAWLKKREEHVLDFFASSRKRQHLQDILEAVAKGRFFISDRMRHNLEALAEEGMRKDVRVPLEKKKSRRAS